MAIDTIFKSGDDSLSNQFSIIISPLLGIFDNPAFAELRAVSVDIPEYTVETYEINYRSQTMDKPSGIIAHSKETSIAFRSDKSYTLYENFRNWITFIHNPTTGIITEDVSPLTQTAAFRTDITVYPTDSSGARLGQGWLFTGAFPTEVGSISYDYSDGEPIQLDVTFKYLKPSIPL